MLIGERPGLTSPDSLGIYLTWDPHPGRTDAERNCISNVRTEGLGYALAARKLHFVMSEGSRAEIVRGGAESGCGNRANLDVHRIAKPLRCSGFLL